MAGRAARTAWRPRVAGATLAALLLGGGAVIGAAPAPPAVPAPGVAGAPRIAILPIEDLSGAAAPTAALEAALRDRLQALGVQLVDAEGVERFMRAYRVRDVGGIGGKVAEALRSETGADAVLLTSADLYARTPPPRLALTARLVGTTAATPILWMDSASLAGDQAPGFLGLGRIDDPGVVRDKVIGRIATSLADGLAARAAGRPRPAPPLRGQRRFRPIHFYRAPAVTLTHPGPLRVAVLPFADESTTRNAGELVALQFVRFLVQGGGVEVIEPGVVRDALLRSRLIQRGGLSRPQSDLLRAVLNVDIVLYGEVMDYLDATGGLPEPELDVSVRAIDTATQQLIWASVSHGRGDDGVFFFGLGRVPTAHALASAMARALVGTILPAMEGSS
jgi:hypothetical protein